MKPNSTLQSGETAKLVRTSHVKKATNLGDKQKFPLQSNYELVGFLRLNLHLTEL